jgi:methylenetetrahydrofolate dehydrogenase (NADP+)/methenyltetrahydrofolate cyclohydrolase
VTARSLGGREVAARLRASATEAVAALAAAGVAPRLAIVIATREESAAWYVRSLSGAAARLGIGTDVTELPADAPAAAITPVLSALSADAAVHGILLQAPLPPGLRLPEIAATIAPGKDVDGASPLALGLLTAGLPTFAPATAQAVIQLLDFHGVELAGRRAVIVGRSLVVGKPLALLLLGRDATVTVCHSRTLDLASITREADVLVVAAGRRGLITAEHVRPGAIVVDVGTNAAPDGSMAGDVEAAGVAAIAGALSPVPGGVGPVTTAQLLLNTVTAAVDQGELSSVRNEIRPSK